jgi:hypothetical protein
VRDALLELGLEDWTPIPEAMTSPEVKEAAGTPVPIRVVADALRTLLSEGKLLVYRGRWDAEPDRVPLSEALLLLQDEYWYTFHIDDPGEVRLYFVNVDNVRR